MIPRHLKDLVVESLHHFPVVLVTGARQVGKSTLVQDIARRQWPARYVTLDDRTTLDAALIDPDGFVRGLGSPVIIDEVQRAPDLLRAIKLEVDRKRRAGRFLLTGSANILTLARVAETLAGRVAVHELRPFSWSERRQAPAPSILEDLFRARATADVLRRAGHGEAPSAEIERFVLSGGYPTVSLGPPGRVRQTWFASYRHTYLERDVRDLTNVSHLADFNRLLATLALRTGQLLNVAELSRDIGLPGTTLRRYVQILEQTYQIESLPPYVANVAKRLVKTPKMYVTDTGLACHLAAIDSWAALQQRHMVGAMTETWVHTELRKLISLSAGPIGLFFFRTHGGAEIDFMLEQGGALVGIEVKSSSRFDARDIDVLRAGARMFPKRWRLGVLLHRGEQLVVIDEHTIAIPFHHFFA